MNNSFSFRFFFLGYLFFSIPFFLLIGILSLFHITPVYFNGKPYDGFIGLITCLVFIPIFSLILSSINWTVLSIGNFMHKIIFRKNIFDR